MKPGYVAVRAAALCAASASAALICGLQAAAGCRDLAASKSATVDSLVGGAAAAGSWAVLGWVALTIGIAAASEVPGAVGAVAARVPSAVAPRVIRRLVVVVVGVTVAGGAAPAFASSTSGVAAGPVRSVGSVGVAESVSTYGSVEPARIHSDDWPLLDRPVGSPNTRATAVVEPGDCLWTIAAEHLEPDVTPAEIATEWPRWYAANRALIGPDPDVLLPGQRLTVPPAT